MALVWHIISATLFFVFVGYLIDQCCHLNVIGTLIGAIVAMIYAVVISIATLNQDDKKIT